MEGLLLVFMISIAKLYDNALGSNNAILFNSDYYRIVLVLGVFLVILMVLLNMAFIPVLGINGAGIATFLAIFMYNSICRCSANGAGNGRKFFYADQRS